MSRLTADQIAALVLARGFRDPVRATAVVLGESGGDTQAVNTSNANGTIDRGLWQLNSVHVDSGKITVADTFDVAKSTDFAYTLSNGGTDFRPWTATRRASFAGHLDTARAAVARVRDQVPEADNSGAPWWRRALGAAPFAGAILPGFPVDVPAIDVSDIPVIGGPLDGARDAASIVATIGAKLLDPAFWRRLGLGLLGAIVLAWGVFLFSSQSRRDAARAALGALPVGRAAKVAGAAGAAN